MGNFWINRRGDVERTRYVNLIPHLRCSYTSDAILLRVFQTEMGQRVHTTLVWETKRQRSTRERLKMNQKVCKKSYKSVSSRPVVILRTGIEPVTLGCRVNHYSPTLFQLSYRRLVKEVAGSNYIPASRGGTTEVPSIVRLGSHDHPLVSRALAYLLLENPTFRGSASYDL